MNNTTADIVIIGAGLSGLCLAYFLRRENLNIRLIEGRSRIGGRIQTHRTENAPIEMGATWLSPGHTELQKLIRELDLEVFEQELGQTAIYEPMANSPHQVVALPAHQEPSFRIKGGTFLLIDSLMNKLSDTHLELNCIVNHIEQKKEGLLVNTSNGTFMGKTVVSTLPPFLFQKTIQVSPALPVSLIDIAKKTHTWMGESIKIGLSYRSPFWREKGLSGTIFSNPGPIPEMYDHSNDENTKFALKGFLNAAYFTLSKGERLELILRQLEKYYGSQVKDYLDYQEMIWQNEPLTFSPYKDHIFPHQHNGNKAFSEVYLNNNLFISGSETAEAFPGYMEGAVRSAQAVFRKLVKG